MKKFFHVLARICKNLVIFTFLFTLTQMTRELIFRPIVVNTVGPIKVERHFYVDEAFDMSENFLIASSIAEWEKKTGGILTFRVHYFTTAGEFLTIKDRKAIAITKMSIYDPFVEEVEEEQGKLLGLHTKNFSTEIIILNTERFSGDPLEFRSTTMHEIGHALGLEHSAHKYTLMYPSADYAALHITKKDLIQFCYLHLCKVEDLLRN